MEWCRGDGWLLLSVVEFPVNDQRMEDYIGLILSLHDS